MSAAPEDVAVGAGEPPLDQLLSGSPYVAYLYSYPHKTAYRRLDPARELADVWRQQRRDALFLYLHVPFCEMRCGFCNLFSRPYPQAELVDAYLDILARQAALLRDALDGPTFARVAVGGGTPTHLEPRQLARLFASAETILGGPVASLPSSVEVSPETSTAERLQLLVDHGVRRVSIGVQSFIEDELRALVRRQRNREVYRALERIRARGFPTLNIDLIYGIEGQTVDSWRQTLRETLRFQPEEVFLYPLYVRPLTTLDVEKRDLGWDDQRRRLYRAGRDLLLDAGYRQLSMRMFRATSAPDDRADPPYRCQEDGMVGLGCGARSYTDALHYSAQYAVGVRGVREILAHFVARSDAELSRADYGFELGPEDRRRRFAILSLLHHEGLDGDAYRRRFGSDPAEDLPQLQQLVDAAVVRRDDARLRLTADGVERSDAIGPWLRSARVCQLMATCELR